MGGALFKRTVEMGKERALDFGRSSVSIILS